MKNLKPKSIINISIAALIIALDVCLLTLYLVSEFLSAGSYNVRMIKENVSPDGSFRAVNFEWNSRTTEGYVNRVSLLKSDRKLNRKDQGNIFIGESEVAMHWNNDTLYVCCNRESEIYKRVNSYDGVTIKYCFD
jgi:hypothetical protein